MEPDKIQILIDKFISHQQTHPVLSQLWVDSLEECKVKLQSIKRMLDQGESIVDKLPNDVNDPNITTILLLMTILSDYNSSNNLS
jgi:hypothetical protein